MPAVRLQGEGLPSSCSKLTIIISVANVHDVGHNEVCSIAIPVSIVVPIVVVPIATPIVIS
jgi:hypothetical protein